MNRRILNILWLSAAFVSIFLCHFLYLGWGTPSAEKNKMLFKDPSEIGRLIPKFIELRDKYYSGINDMLNPEKPLKDIYKKMFIYQKDIPMFQELGQEQVLDRMRGYMIGVLNHDEQHTIMVLSKINPLKLKFNPGINTFYGGVFYYTCGASLLVGKLAGFITLKSDIAYYFTHPVETQRIYMLVRGVGAVSVLLTAVLMLVLLTRIYSLRTALLAVSFFAATPVLVNYSHRAGAHNLGMLFLLIGIALCWKFFNDPDRKNYIYAGIALGLCAGTLVTNLPAVMIIFLAEWARQDWNWKKTINSANAWLSCGVFMLVYFATNFYIYLDLTGFHRFLLMGREYTMQMEGEVYGTLNLKKWVPFIIDTFTNQMHWSTAPLFVLGCVYSFKKQNRFFQLCSLCLFFLLLMNLLLTRHPGVNIRILPLCAIICAAGAMYLLETKNSLLRILYASYICFSIAISAFQTYYCASLLKEPFSLTLAGDWINRNVPEGQSIGVVGGQIASAEFPPIHFLNYRMIKFPAPSQNVSFTKDALPDYVVSNQEIDSGFNSSYEKIVSWQKQKKFFGISFDNEWIANGNADILIYKKI